ncbi:MAG: hypothetical protein LBV71_02335 [Prevotella sp.]|jgi:hypothetical protein|nr:hypothetical protein [Prevotella sp.]
MKINRQLFDRYLFNKYFISTVVFILVGIIGLYLSNLYDDYFEKKERGEYKKNIVDIYIKLDGYVVDYSMSMVFAGTKLATLSTGEKFFIRTVPYGLLSCLDEGDYLYKPANTDSIFVTKPDGTRFLFIAPHWR